MQISQNLRHVSLLELCDDTNTYQMEEDEVTDTSRVLGVHPGIKADVRHTRSFSPLDVPGKYSDASVVANSVFLPLRSHRLSHLPRSDGGTPEQSAAWC